jgi:2-oxo-4-hydroxy-4-carboxy--5-ureidoimidazoline (OHCU) decarboxylase
MSKIDDLINRYTEAFEQNFPVYLVMGMKEDEIIQAIEKSLKNGIPFEPEIDEGKDY